MNDAVVRINVRRSLPQPAALDLPNGLTLQSTDGPCGYRVEGLNLADDLDSETTAAFVWMVNHCGLLIVPGQKDLTPERQAEITKWLGRPFVRGMFADTVDKMATVNNTPVQILGSQAKDPGNSVPAADVDSGKRLGPHSDVQDYEIPPAITLLHGVEVPPSSAGGNTYFTNLYDAYDLLSEDLKTKLAKATWRPLSTQAVSYGVGMEAAKKDVNERGLQDHSVVRQPVVRTHPITLRKALWLSTFSREIYGVEDEDAPALLRRLIEHVNAEERWYKHVWTEHDLLVWDNRCMNHWREGWDVNYRRTMHRSQADGSRAF